MKKKVNLHLYTKDYTTFVNGQFQNIVSEDGMLFSKKRRKTSVRVEDLPEWYVHGWFYKRDGYMSTKGITDMKYKPNMFVNHFLKDDFLYISYGGKVVEKEDQRWLSCDCDEFVFGSEILYILKGASIYSNYDISGIVEQLKEKKKWLQTKYPDQFGPDKWNFDIDEFFRKPFDNRRKRSQ